MRTTVVVVTWRGRAHIERCLDALAAQDRAHRTLVVDNGSDDGTAELLARRDLDVLRLPENLGYAGALARALPGIGTEFMAWLNDDAAPAADWLSRMEDALADPDVGAASARLGHAGTVQSDGVGLNADGYGADQIGGDPFGFCGGAALLRSETLRAIGGVPGEFFCYYEDTDTSWRMRLHGKRIVSVPDALVEHAHGASSAPGSSTFHLWNERNRLAMLLRCAPLRVAGWQLVKFVLLLLRPTPDTLNFAVGLRLRVLKQLLAGSARILVQRRAIGKNATVERARVWRTWAGKIA